jgi:hypothetical protein
LEQQLPKYRNTSNPLHATAIRIAHSHQKSAPGVLTLLPIGETTMHKLLRSIVIGVCLGAGLSALLAAQTVGTTQTLDTILSRLTTVDVGSLIPSDDPVAIEASSTPAATSNPAKLPPGTKFKLFGTAMDDTDPENPFNEVISFDTRNPLAIAGAVKLFGDQVKVPMLDDQVELKYYYVDRTCGGGSTRFQLGIDSDGDGKFDGNAFGYVGDKPFGGGCLMNQWVYEDMTNNVKKWDLSQFPGSAVFCGGNSMICSWTDMENYFTTVWPNHRVLNEVLVDDSQGFFPADSGCAYFDLVSAGTRTLIDHDDTNNNPQAANGC